MQAQDIMTTNVATVTPNTGIRDIAHLMIDRHISGVPVVDLEGQLVGMVTDGDLYRRTELGTDKKQFGWLKIFHPTSKLAREYIAGQAHTAGDLMTTQVFAVAPQTSVRQIADLLERERIRRVPVVVDGLVVGIVSRANLMQALISSPVENLEANLNDRRVRDLVIAEYKRLPCGMLPEGNVTVADGVVHVWGYLSSDAQRDALRVAVEAIPGAKGFEDHTYQYFGDADGRQQRPSRIIVEEPDDAGLEEILA
jgi:CBS domain-containing protein